MLPGVGDGNRGLYTTLLNIQKFVVEGSEASDLFSVNVTLRVMLPGWTVNKGV